MTQACESLCVRVQQLCTRDAAAACRARCGKYIVDENRCGEPIKQALSCQARTQNTTICLNIATPSCLEEFRRMAACRSGQAPTAAPEQPQEELPADWRRVRDDALGVSILLPPDAALDAQASNRTWRGTHGGAEYFLAAIPPPDGGLTQRGLVQMTLQYLGLRCQKGLRLHGRYEVDDRTLVRFESACVNGASWQGMLHIWPSKAVVVALRAPAGAQVLPAPFFASFQPE